MPSADRYAVVFDGYVTSQGTKSDAIFASAGERSAEKATMVFQRYKPKTPKSEFEFVGPTVFLKHDQNLLNH